MNEGSQAHEKVGNCNGHGTSREEQKKCSAMMSGKCTGEWEMHGENACPGRRVHEAFEARHSSCPEHTTAQEKRGRKNRQRGKPPGCHPTHARQGRGITAGVWLRARAHRGARGNRWRLHNSAARLAAARRPQGTCDPVHSRSKTPRAALRPCPRQPQRRQFALPWRAQTPPSRRSAP